MTSATEPVSRESKEMTVAMSFTVPLSLAQWIQDFMRRNGVGRSETIEKGLRLLMQQEEQAA